MKKIYNKPSQKVIDVDTNVALLTGSDLEITDKGTDTLTPGVEGNARTNGSLWDAEW